MEMSRAVQARNAGVLLCPRMLTAHRRPPQAVGHLGIGVFNLGIGVFKFGLLCGAGTARVRRVTLASASIPDQAFGTIVNY